MSAEQTKTKRMNKGVLALFAVALACLIASISGSAYAALTYYSETYGAHVELPDIGVTLVENGQAVANRDYTGADDKWDEKGGGLLQHMLKDGEEFRLGVTYPEQLAVTNSGNIDEYVRVIVSKYWLDDKGVKVVEMDPAMIDVHYTEDGWIEDKDARTPERTVWYYTQILPKDATSKLFADTITINDELARKVTTEETTDEQGYTTVVHTFDYNGYQFVLKAEVDAVQTHNAVDAIKSAWGVDVEFASDGTMSLK